VSVAKLTTSNSPNAQGGFWKFAEELGGVMAEKLAELFAESATEQHALRPERRRCLDS